MSDAANEPHDSPKARPHGTPSHSDNYQVRPLPSATPNLSPPYLEPIPPCPRPPARVYMDDGSVQLRNLSGALGWGWKAGYREVVFFNRTRRIIWFRTTGLLAEDYQFEAIYRVGDLLVMEGRN